MRKSGNSAHKVNWRQATGRLVRSKSEAEKRQQAHDFTGRRRQGKDRIESEVNADS